MVNKKEKALAYENVLKEMYRNPKIFIRLEMVRVIMREQSEQK
jgi:hypothetical protein